MEPLLQMERLVFAFIIITQIHNVVTKNNDGFDGILQTKENYGPFILEYEEFEQCAGPKPVNLTSLEARMVKLSDFKYKAYFNFTVFTDAKIEKITIRVYNIKEKRKNILWQYRVEKPCQHYVFNKIIEEKAHAENCVLKKGYHEFEMDLSEFNSVFFGTKFFYGEIFFRSLLLSKKGNLFCLISKQRFLKKP